MAMKTANHKDEACVVELMLEWNARYAVHPYEYFLSVASNPH